MWDGWEAHSNGQIHNPHSSIHMNLCKHFYHIPDDFFGTNWDKLGTILEIAKPVNVIVLKMVQYEAILILLLSDDGR